MNSERDRGAAIATLTVHAAGADNCQVTVDYDDVTLRVSLLRVVNQSAAVLWVQVTRLESGASWSRLFPANTTQTLDLSTRNIRLRTTPVPDPSKPPVLAKAGIAIALRWPA